MPGPFYFAWSDADEPFDDAVHNREDELVFAFTIAQNEGDFATLEIEIANPRVGLLAPGRKTWCWFSWFDGAQITPLFRGRLVGIPDSIIEDVVTLTFIARPVGYDDLKAALADTLRVAPYYNAIWLADDKKDDPDAVLEGYSRLWHIDRITLAVTTSDVIVGEDGVIELDALEMFYDGLELSVGQVPLTSIKVTGTVGWRQKASGAINLNPGTFNAPAAHQLLSEWPESGTSLDGGWTVKQATAIDVLDSEHAETVSSGSEYTNNETEHASGDVLSISISTTEPVNLRQTYTPPQVTNSKVTIGFVDPFADPVINTPGSVESSLEWTLRYIVDTTLIIGYDADRERSEVLSFKLDADFQAILTEPADDDRFEEIELSATIPDSPSPHHFATDAGASSIEYLICLARAHLLARSRAVQITVECKWESSLVFTCRKNFLLNDPRLPGGQALGKISAYTLRGDGDSGQFLGTVTFACSIGVGSSLVTDPGQPTYAEDGYVDNGYQYRSDALIALASSDIAYTPPPTTVTDDGVTFPLGLSSALLSPIVKTSASFGFTLRNLTGGPYTATYSIPVSKLIAPRQIDLEAS